MELTTEKLLELSEEYGDAFYLLDSDQFEKNYEDLCKAFSDIYPHFNIAYSYKTNYIPKLCRIVKNHGGYAEVVSDMEMEIAIRVGVIPVKIIWNGPVKNNLKVEELLIAGGTVNVDSLDELVSIKKIIEKHPDNCFNLGVRCNFDVGDGVVSRFGFDVDSADFKEVIDYIKSMENVKLINLQCHFAKRSVEYWPARAEGMVKVVKEVAQEIGYIPERVDLGGGIFGNMEESLKEQFSCPIPEYKEYAKAAATVIRNAFPDTGPELLIEPGSALAGDSMKFVGRIETIKNVRGKTFATMLGSQKNISMSGVNPPIRRYAVSSGNEYQNVDIVGYTCIESDVLYRGYNGTLAIGDYIVFSNCGSYSIVMKPPFIMPNFAVIDICGETTELIKKAENFEDLLHTYEF
jgi:diaminopimelate decarboxylase